MRTVPSRIGFLLCFLALLWLPFTVTQGAGQTPLLQVKGAKPGKPTFVDLAGKRYSVKDGPAIYFFLSTECEVTNRYTSRFLALEKAFKPLGIRFFAVYPNENEAVEDIRQHASATGLQCPVVQDSNGLLITYFGVSLTPEARLVDRNGTILYQGRIDDNADSEQVRSRDLAAAVLAMYTDRPIPRTRTLAFGSPIRLATRVMNTRAAMVKPSLPQRSRSLETVVIQPTAATAPRPEDRPSALSSLKAASAILPAIAPPSRPALTLRPDRRRPALQGRDNGSTEGSEGNPAVTASLPSEPVSAGGAPLDGIKASPATATTSRPKNTVVTTSITYARDVAPILFERCLPCHRQGEVAPFRLDTYEQAVTWAAQIKEAVTARRMPPWKANSRGEFHDEMRLSNREIAVITSWANGGTPYGRVIDLPLLPSYPRGWKIGDPDAVLSMTDEYTVPSEGRDVYRCFVIPTNFTSDRWIAGIEYQPGNRGVAHHVSAFIDTSGKARALDLADSGPGYTNPTPANGPGFTPVAGQLGGWVPGHTPRKLPPGVGIFLPKGADIVLEVHYHPSGKPEKDRTRFGLHFASDEITKRLRIGDVTNANFRIPAGAADYEVEAYAFLPDDITLLSISPHMHNIGRSMRVIATLPSGVTQVLVDIPSWDFRWQPSYRFKSPVHLPRRTRIDLVAHFDNSDKNPSNPNRPPKEMTYGESTTDEMCTVFMAYTLDREDVREEGSAASGQTPPGSR